MPKDANGKYYSEKELEKARLNDAIDTQKDIIEHLKASKDKSLELDELENEIGLAEIVLDLVSCVRDDTPARDGFVFTAQARRELTEIELFSESRAYNFEYNGYYYNITIAWEQTTNHIEKRIYDEKGNALEGEEAEAILDLFEAELTRQEKKN